MELFGSLRQKAGRMILRNRLSSVRRLQHGFDIEKVKKVGILWDATFEKDFQHLANLNRLLIGMDKSVEVLTWVPGKSVPDRLTGLSYMKFLKKEDLNWAFVPVSGDAKEFINTKFDLIIDINPASLFQLMYITSLSAAPMKVGPDISAEPEKAPYDLMIKTSRPFSIALFLEQAMHYLTMISGPDSRA
jgi:hypothetical protein